MDLLCWGNGELGQTGCGKTRDIIPEEAHLEKFTASKLGTVKLLACGWSHSVVVTVDNRIFAWGNGTSGQLGDGERTVKDQPVEVRLTQELSGEGADVPGASVVGVACGSRHCFIWTETGQAYSFGNNFYAQLGYDFQRADFKEHQLAPRLFQNLPSSLKTSQVACGERHTLFALEDGSVAACGHNDRGQIGCGSYENAPVPRFVELVGRVSKVACGANHSLALTGDGRLFQWGCGRACGNVKRNILLPEDVTLPSSPVRDVAGGCWHSLLLTDGGNVFSWGTGREGQLGLGEDSVHISAPRLLSYSQPVTQIEAGDSYSTAVTAGGELLLWGQIPCGSWVSDHPGLRRLWTPQSVPLAGRKVLHTPQEQVRPEETQGQAEDEESEREEEDEWHNETPNKEEDEGALPSSAFRSAVRMDKRGNGHSSFKSGPEDEREAAGPWELTKGGSSGRDVVYTTLHVLPKSEGERCRPSTGTLPRLLAGQRAFQKERTTHLTELLHKSEHVCSTVKPQPPPGRADLGTQSSTSRHRSRMRAHAVLKSAVCNTFPHLGSGQHVQIPTFSLCPQPGAESRLCRSPSSGPLCPAHRRGDGSFGDCCGSTTSGSRSFK